ncbi:MAG: flavodoxin domain-containing protein [Desulfohalobiaceae bacterium]|nr:flavodoxin domain-containing protein [Desulfohalobiaceae bacterium]
MTQPFEIAENIYQVGVADWNIRDFHGYSTHKGTTYNAFLILDDKITLVDTVKHDFTDQLLSNISRIVDPKNIDYVVSNHTEMDHSGGLPGIMHAIGEDKPVFCSKMGAKNLSSHFERKLNYQAVKDLGELSLGQKKLTFLETRMIHWPDSMFTYLNEDRILFSSDGFGQHYAGPARFDDEGDDHEIMYQARKYYANILLLYSPLIAKLLEKVGSMGLPIDCICPDHGVIWRKDPGRIIEAYARWSGGHTENKAVVVYDTMWKSTKIIAEAIADGIAAQGVTALPIHIRSSDRSAIMTEAMEAKAVVVGSPTLNNQIFPSVADVLTYMKGLKPMHKIGAAFGSYGWSGESVKLITRELEEMKFDLADEGLKIQYVPNKDDLKACFDYGQNIGRKVRAALDA